MATRTKEVDVVGRKTQAGSQPPSEGRVVSRALRWTPVTAPPPTEEAAEEVVNEFWRKAPNVADIARSRAQVSFSIVGVVAAALVSGAVFLGRRDATWITTATACAAVALWIAAVLHYLNAANKPLDDGARDDPYLKDMPVNSTQDVALYITNVFQRERQDVVQKTRRANILATAAIVFTGLTAASVWFGPSPTTRKVSVVLRPDTCASLHLNCGARTRAEGELATDDLVKEYVRLKVAGDSPNGSPISRVIYIPRAAVLGVEEIK